jgi:hypothetical protein
LKKKTWSLQRRLSRPTANSNGAGVLFLSKMIPHATKKGHFLPHILAWDLLEN